MKSAYTITFFLLFIVWVAPIYAQQIKITSPNGSEQFYTGETHKEVKWTSSGIGSFVKIEHSSDGGTTWSISSPLEPNDGSYMWHVPFIPSDNYLIRVIGCGIFSSCLDTAAPKRLAVMLG
jgi:hypothetical protein